LAFWQQMLHERKQYFDHSFSDSGVAYLFDRSAKSPFFTDLAALLHAGVPSIDSKSIESAFKTLSMSFASEIAYKPLMIIAKIFKIFGGYRMPSSSRYFI